MQPFPALTLGSPELPPLVFLHGFLGRGSDWLPIAQSFSDSFYCILPDLPGHGSNIDLPLSTVLSYDFFADGLLATLPDDRPINLVGYSMGGRIALYFALQYPERVQKLVLESTNPGILLESAREDRARWDDQWAETIHTKGMDAFVEAWYDMPLFRSLHRQPELLTKNKTTRKENSPTWMAKIISELSPGRQPWLGNRLLTLYMPVLLLAGKLDEKYASSLESFAKSILHSRAELIFDAGHSINGEQPDLFTAIISDFL